MRKIILILVAFVFTASFSQNTQGTIKYRESTNNKIFMDEISESIDSSVNEQSELNGMAEMMKAQILKEMSKNSVKQKELIFHTDVSLYKDHEEGELTEEDIEPGSMSIVMSGESDSEIKYIDNLKKVMITQREFMGKKFLIKETLPSYKWKLTNERTKILGYNCIKALKVDSNLKTEVWFTSQIPISSGPNGISGLPGMILAYKLLKISTTLESEKPEEEVMLAVQAISIDLSPIDKKKIKKPKKGKVLSSEDEYNKLVEKRTQSMFEGQGGGNIIMIK
jgi:GLPGLI family protein